jgi:hypothetical protein
MADTLANKAQLRNFRSFHHLPAVHDDFAPHFAANARPFILPGFFVADNDDKYDSRSSALAIDEPSDLSHYLLDLLFAEFRVHGQGEHLLLRSLTLREIA